MTVHELTPADYAALREAAKPVLAKHAKSVGEDLVNEVNAELAKMRGGAAKK
jgi:hypothetical protein